MRHVLQNGETLTAVMSGAAATTNPKVRVQTSGGDSFIALSGTTAVTLASGPCVVSGLSMNNIDTGSVTVTLAHVIGGTSNTIIAAAVGVGYTLVSEEAGFRILDASGQLTSISSLSVAQAQAFTNTLTTTDGVASGTARRVGGIASRSIAASTAQLGTVETRVVLDQTYTMPANTLKVGTILKIRALVFHTATTGSEVHTLAVAFDSTDLAVTGNLDPADNGCSVIEFTVICRAAGASGSVVGFGTCTNGVRAAALTATHGLMTGTTGTSTQTIDTTAAIVVGIAIDRQASASDTDSCRLDFLSVEVIG